MRKEVLFQHIGTELLKQKMRSRKRQKPPYVVFRSIIKKRKENVFFQVSRPGRGCCLQEPIDFGFHAMVHASFQTPHEPWQADEHGRIDFGFFWLYLL